MIVVALNTGMRVGVLQALQWDDIDLVAGRLIVKRSVWNGIEGTPKSGRSREIPLNAKALSALKAHRHLRGPYVFCQDSERPLSDRMVDRPIRATCKRAGLLPFGFTRSGTRSRRIS